MSSSAIARSKEMARRVGEIRLTAKGARMCSWVSAGFANPTWHFSNHISNHWSEGAASPSGSQMAVNERRWRRKRVRGKRDGSHFEQGDPAGFSPEMQLVAALPRLEWCWIQGASMMGMHPRRGDNSMRRSAKGDSPLPTIPPLLPSSLSVPFGNHFSIARAIYRRRRSPHNARQGVQPIGDFRDSPLLFMARWRFFGHICLRNPAVTLPKKRTGSASGENSHDKGCDFCIIVT